MFGMPDIPDYNGVVSGATDSLISFGGAFLINKLFGNYWGIFSDVGIPIVLADNVVSLTHKNTSRISQAPVEKGTFTSYNKVSDPAQITIQMTKSTGGATGRGLFLAQLEALQYSTMKFYVITPEYVYKNYSIRDIDQSRSAQDGATLLKINIHLEEVREVSAEYEDKSKNPEDSATKDTGEATVT